MAITSQGCRMSFLWLNTFFCFFGISLLIICSLNFGWNNLLIPKLFIISVSVMIFLFSILGCYGIRKVYDKIANEQTQCSLCIYSISSSLLLGAEIFLLFLLFSLAGHIKFDHLHKWSDQTIREALVKQNASWFIIQNKLKCCGYDNVADNLATGELCIQSIQIGKSISNYTLPVSFHTCKTQILHIISQWDAIYIAIVSTLLLLQITATIISLSFVCCTSFHRKNLSIPPHRTLSNKMYKSTPSEQDLPLQQSDTPTRLISLDPVVIRASPAKKQLILHASVSL